MKAKVLLKVGIIGLVLAVLLSYIQLPYYVTKPGMAEELAPLVKVEGGYHDKGSLMLTTVRMGKANVFSYAYAKFSDYQYIYPIKQIRYENESDEEYTMRQLNLMENSQESAVVVAFRHAKKPVDIQYNGIYVMGIEPDMPAEKIFKPGDKIVKIDGHVFETAQKFITYVSDKKEGDKVRITFVRNTTEKEATITLKSFPKDPSKVGLGISIVANRVVDPEPDVSIDSEKIGGPSAGLMFSLEIYNQLTKDDLTKGYDIAGTGTINDDGLVGPIGGISQKIVAADNAGAEIFFAPKENYQEAMKAAKDIKTNMIVVKVEKFADPLQYLQKLKEKE